MDALAAYGSSSSDSDNELEESEKEGNTSVLTSVTFPKASHMYSFPEKQMSQNALQKMDLTMYKRKPLVHDAPRLPTVGYVSKRKRGTRVAESEGTSSDSGTSNEGLAFYLRGADVMEASKRKKLSNGVPKSCEQLPNEHCKPVVSLNWHAANSKVLLSCSLDGTARLWDILQKKCIVTMSPHSGAAVSCGHWVTCNTIVTGGFNRLVCLSDVEKSQVVSSFSHRDFVSVVQLHPEDNNLLFTGDFGSNIQSWDLRTGKAIKQYVGAGGKILDMTFLHSGHEFVAASDIVRKNASSQALRVWDVDSTVVVSNQVYTEPYTCPCLQTHPYKHEFYAQSNANYIVVFSGRKPYKCNKYKRYERHRVEGNKVQFDVSPDGTLLCSASANGQVVVYDCETSSVMKTLCISNSSCIAVAWNQHSHSTIAVSDWNSHISLLE